MELMDEIAAITIVVICGEPFLLIVGCAAYLVYSPKFSTYDTIEECEGCRHENEPYCAACWRCKYNPLYWVHKRRIYNGPSLAVRYAIPKKWRNDMKPNTSTCRSCGTKIVWKKTASGKSMPCEASPVDIVLNPDSKIKVLDKYGSLIPCDIVDTPSENTELGWIPHWQNCNAPDQFRKR